MAGSFKWKTLLVGLSVMGVLAAGCSSNNSGSNNSGAETNTPATNASNAEATNTGTDSSGPVKGGTLTVATFSDIVTTNPLYVQDTSSGDAAYFMFADLLDYDKDGNIVAEPWSLLDSLPEISADSKTYTLKLKANAKWSDGQPVTADDIAFTINTAINPKAASPQISAFDKVDKVEVIDPQTAKITLKTVFAPFLNLLVTAIAPSHVLKDIPVDQLQKNSYGTDPAKTVTNGPWKWSEWQQKQYLSFEKDPNYWAKDTNDVIPEGRLDQPVRWPLANPKVHLARSSALRVGEECIGRVDHLCGYAVGSGPPLGESESGNGGKASRGMTAGRPMRESPMERCYQLF